MSQPQFTTSAVPCHNIHTDTGYAILHGYQRVTENYWLYGNLRSYHTVKGRVPSSDNFFRTRIASSPLSTVSSARYVTNRLPMAVAESPRRLIPVLLAGAAPRPGEIG